MLETLKVSPEPKYLVDAAVRYLRGVKGSLAQSKKRAREAAEAKAWDQSASQGASSGGFGNGYQVGGPSNEQHVNNASSFRPQSHFPGATDAEERDVDVEKPLRDALAK
jgi:hypothetical protein